MIGEPLEVSIVPCTEVLRAASTGRFDAEYFQQKYLADAATVARSPALFRSARELDIQVDASAFYPSIEDYYDSGALPFYRVADVDGLIDIRKATTVPEDLCVRFPTLKVAEPGDILFTKGGAIDRTGLVVRRGAASRDLIFLRTSRVAMHQRLFLFAYFQTEFFRRQLLRSSSQTAQAHLTVTLVRDLPLFLGSPALIDAVANTLQAAYSKYEESTRRLDEAESALVASLNIRDNPPDEPLCYVARADRVAQACRFDAQYFMPAKERMRQLLATEQHWLLGQLVTSVKQVFVPRLSGPSLYVRNYDVTDALEPLLDAAKSTELGSAVGSNKKEFRSGDVVISRLRAYLREIAVVQSPDATLQVGSSEFIVLRPRSEHAFLSPETLLVFLRSWPVQAILKWCQDGSQHPRFGESDLLAIPVPRSVAVAAPSVTNAVREAFAARADGGRLLSLAVQAVERAVNHGIDSALNFMSTQRSAN